MAYIPEFEALRILKQMDGEGFAEVESEDKPPLVRFGKLQGAYRTALNPITEDFQVLDFYLRTNLVKSIARTLKTKANQQVPIIPGALVKRLHRTVLDGGIELFQVKFDVRSFQAKQDKLPLHFRFDKTGQWEFLVGDEAPGNVPDFLENNGHMFTIPNNAITIMRELLDTTLNYNKITSFFVHSRVNTPCLNFSVGFASYEFIAPYQGKGDTPHV